MEIILQEYETWPFTVEDKKIAKELKLQESDVELGNSLNEKGIIQFKQLNYTELEIKTNSYIGTVNFHSFKLTIIPKIYSKDNPEIWKNIALCIYYVNDFDTAKFFELSKIKFENESQILQDFIIMGFALECENLIRHGLLKSYVNHQENLSFLRGKLILKNQFQNDISKNAKFFCEYDELEYDNIENRIILDSLLISERLVQSESLKRKIFVLINQFSQLVSKTTITLYDIERIMSNYDRQNFRYFQIHTFCKLIKENSGISDFYSQKISYSIPFFVNMNEIFEKFVTKLFLDFFNSGTVYAQKTQKAWNIDDKGSIKIRPDIILKDSKNKSITIIDAKYKDRLYESDLYQIGFYIHEYRDPHYTGDEAYAILPKYYAEKSEKREYVATKSKIKIHARYLDVNHFIQKIYDDSFDRQNMELELDTILK